MKVPILDLNAQYKDIIDEIKHEINKVMDKHQYILGPQVKELEEKIAEFCNCDFAIGCASGSDALVLALMAVGVNEGDEVITTPFTFFATAGSVHRVGAKPVFVDINPKTFNIDPEKIEKAITPKTKAIMPVHLFGQAADMDAIMAIAQKHNLKVIEDNAQGIGALYKGKTAGTIGDIGTLSFFPSKNLGAMGDGGMCLTNDPELAQKLMKLRVHGEVQKYYHKWVGFNSRLDSIQAAVLIVKLAHLQNWSTARQKNAKYYFEQLSGLKQIVLPHIEKDCVSIFNQFSILAEKRDELMQYLLDNGIGCAIYYPKPLHLQECFSYLNYKEGDFPVSENTANKVISIPIFSELTKEQQDYIISTIKKFYSC
ncbi:MAG: DegT/DnrJ/EryC1/StrS family aminotransferase [Candidatus Cloacimonetes bacterium]|nr:DegT/DnrJ/EryC1/StrS family aminotransferase [Candidatus Cloacimonadota bacterium]